MSNIDEKEVTATELLTETEEISEASTAVDETEDIPKIEFEDSDPDTDAAEITAVEDAPSESAKKKKPFLQVPVIISLCLVILSLLAFFAYKIFWISEPEGVTWVWSSETDNVNWYYEFKDDNVFKAYVGSFEITANYSKDKSDEEVNKLMVSADVPYAQSVGCIFFGSEINYNITGSRLAGNQEMSVTYAEDPEEQVFVLKQTNDRESDLELPDDFKENEELTGEWINIYSTDDAKQTIVFNDDGSMILAEAYTFSEDNFTEIRRNCTYTADESEINITWKAEETVVHNAEYVIKDGILTMDGASYYRADREASTPDETQ